MTEWLLSGHNTQEWAGVARLMSLTATEAVVNDQTIWVLNQLAGDHADLDQTLKPIVLVQGRVYLSINYLLRNVAAVLPFDSASVGVPAEQVPAELMREAPRLSQRQQLQLLLRFGRLYRWAAHFYRRKLADHDYTVKGLYWQLREDPLTPLPVIRSLFEPEFFAGLVETARAHAAITMIVTVLDSTLRRQAPQLLSLFVGQATATALIGQRVWDLRQTAEQCGPEVCRMLQEGMSDLDAYRVLPAAAPLVTGVQTFLREYGHRGFRFERDFETERLADHPEHVLLAVAGQLSEEEPPEVRAEAARRVALKALRQMNLAQRRFWQWTLRWGRRLLSWRENSNSSLALGQATYGLAARLMARRFYPGLPDDVMMFYTLDEFLACARSGGEQRVDQDALNRRRAQFELHRMQTPPPELIWYDPLTRRWRPALEQEKEPSTPTTARMQGIAASAGSGPVEGIAVVTNDPLDAGRRLLELQGPVILITRLTDPAWSSLFRRLSAVVTELGGVISHAAIVARENGLPAVVGVPEATRWVRDGQRLRVDGAAGTVEVIG